MADEGVKVEGGPIEAVDPNATKTYYLKEGKEHSFYQAGTLHTINQVNDEAELTEAGYEAFKDKFSDTPNKVAAAPSEDDKPSEKSDEPATSPASGKANAGAPAKPASK